MNKKDLEIISAAKKPIRIIIIVYAIIKVSFIIAAFDPYVWVLRAFFGMALIIAAYILTSLRIKRQLMAVLVPFVLVTIELTHTLISAYGDRLIYLFVIGALLTSLPYRSPAGLIGAMVLNLTVTGVFAFILGMNFNSYLFHITLQDEVFNFSGVIALYLAIFLFNHFSLRYLNKHHDVGILFENILENSSSLKVITNDKAKIEHASQSLAEFFNIGKREYAINLPLADLFPTDELKVYFNELFRRKGYISEKFETNIKGEHYWFSLRSVPVDESSIARFFELEDITLLVKSQEEAIRSNHAKSQFLATMSHEIRTPMNAIIGISQIQLQKAGIPGEYADAFDRIYDSGRSLLGIINDILDLSKIETGKMELNPVEYDVPSVVYDVVQLNILRIGGKPVEFLLDIDENLPSKMIGDELRLKQILTNLLSNAIKYTEKGHVKLIISHSMSGEDVTLRFDIEDTGQGMKPEDVKRLFTEYTRFNIDTNRAVEGTGIGLNIANSLAALMDGNITVVSGYGKGSIFTLTVKQKAVTCETIGADLAGRLKKFTFSESSWNKQEQIIRELMPYGKVLVVDDVETNLYVAEGLMSPYGLKIDTADSGYAAIEKVKSGNTYDVIFMDHMMPNMDGIETTLKLRTMGYQGVIVALTANALVGNDEMFKQKKFDGLITKPIDVRELNAALNKFVRDKYPEEAKKYKKIINGPQGGPQNIEYETPSLPAKNPKLIEVFCRDAEKAVKTLRETAASGGIKLFTTTVHAMKSALLNFGEPEKSKLAAALENAGLTGDMEFITANTENFLEALESLIKSLKLVKTAKTGYVNISEDMAFLKEQLFIIKAACEEYDDEAAYAAFDMLKEKPWNAGTSAMIEKIHDMLFLHSDFEGAAEQVDLYVNKISK